MYKTQLINKLSQMTMMTMMTVKKTTKWGGGGGDYNINVSFTNVVELLHLPSLTHLMEIKQGKCNIPYVYFFLRGEYVATIVPHVNL